MHRSHYLMAAILLILPFLSIEVISAPQESIEIELPADPGILPESIGTGDGIFTENLGQIENENVLFTAVSQVGDIGFFRDGVMIKQTASSVPGPSLKNDIYKIDPMKNGVEIVKFNFVDANKVIPMGRDPVPWLSNYFLGRDPSKWTTGVRSYREIIYPDLWDGIDLVYRMVDGGMKYDIVVHPFADHEQVRMRVEGTSDVELSAGNDLTIMFGTRFENTLTDTGLDVFYEDKNEEKIKACFLVEGDTYSFDLENRDRTRTVVIDPIMYSTYLGGASWEEAWDMEVDQDGCVYITRHTDSMDFPTSIGAYDDTYNGGDWDVFVSKLSTTGDTLEFSTYIGGSDLDIGVAIKIDHRGNAYIGGSTLSTDFPTTPGAYSTSHDGESNFGFALKLGPNGDSLTYSTFIGGLNADAVNGIDVDDAGNAYLVGITESWDFPVSTGAYDTIFNQGVSDTFVAKLSPTGSSLIYCTFLGGTGRDEPYDIAVDSSGCAYVSGELSSKDYPVTEGAFSRTHGGTRDLFLTKISSSGSSLDFSTYIGGSKNDHVQGMKLDEDGFIYLTGGTFSSNYPTTEGCYDRIHNGDRDVFVTKVNISGDSLIYSTFLGGDFDDFGYGIDVDDDGYAYVIGVSASMNYPTTYYGISRLINGPGVDTVITKLGRNGASLTFSTYVGGEGEDRGCEVVCNDLSQIYIAGYTDSRDFPVTEGAFDTNYSGGQHDIFITKVNASTTPSAPREMRSSFGDSYVDISWKEPRDLGGPARVSYNLYKGPTPLGVRYYKTVNETGYNDTDVTNGEIYYYMVSALNDLGEGGFSTKVSETPGTMPGVPLDLSAIPGNRNVSLSWSPPEDDGGYRVYRYHIFRGLDPEEMEHLTYVDYMEEYLDRKLVNGVTYHYKILAQNTLGKGPETTHVSARPAAFPSAPQSFQVEAGNAIVDLSWAPPENDGGLEILGYRVLRGTEGIGESLLVELDSRTYSYTDLDVTNGEMYYYMVRAYNDLGRGPKSTNISVTPATIPDRPRDFTAKGEDNFVELSWLPPEDNGGYEIIYYKLFRGYGPDDMILLDTVIGNTTYTDPDLKNGVTFYYEIISVTKFGESIPIAAFATPGSVPRKPYGFEVELVGREVSLIWYEPVFDGGFPIMGYYVYRGETIEDMEVLFIVFSENFTGTRLNFIDNSTEKDNIYYYKVTAFNVHGESEGTPELLVRTDEAWDGGGSTVQRIMEFWWLFLLIGLTLSALITLSGYMVVRNQETWLVNGRPQFTVIYRDLRDRAKRTEKKEPKAEEPEKKDQSLR